LKLENKEQEAITQYLLGQTSPEDLPELEERLLTDSAFYEELLTVEDELIDDYLRGELSQLDRESFETHFSTAPERQQKVRFGRAFNKYVAAVDAMPEMAPATLAVSEKARDISKPPKPWYSIFLPSQNPILSYSLMTALVLIVGTVSWFGLKNLRNTGSHDPGKVLAITLTPGLTRSDGDIKKISIPGDTGTVRLQLALSKNEYAKYRAILLTDEGSEIWSDTLPPDLDGRFINVNIPAELLKPGEYQVRLSGQSEAGSFEALDRYSFRVIQIPK
jgi:hypothetical protein